jgi:osmotically-inducible protein OsmY
MKKTTGPQALGIAAIAFATIAAGVASPVLAEDKDNYYDQYRMPAGVDVERVDDAVSAQVRRALAKDPLLSSGLVGVSTQGGVVTLRGTVRSMLARGRAGLVAQAVPGVTSVLNDLRFDETTGTATDFDIRDSAESALRMAGRFEFPYARVRVESGVAYLSGSVRTEQLRQWATQIVEGVPGVVAVKNHLRASIQETPPDQEIAARIQAAAARQAFISPEAMRIQVEQGRVTLAGEVGSFEEKLTAVRDAWASGASGVDASALAVATPVYEERLPQAKYVLPTDAAIAQFVVDALSADSRLSLVPIQVSCLGRTITLRGAVESQQAKALATDIARRVYGVRDVANLLAVRGGPLAAGPLSTDAVLFRAVRDVVETVPGLDPSLVTVTVFDGNVSLIGTVESDARRQYVATMVGRVGGVRRVQNNLAVDPNLTTRPSGTNLR